MAYTFDEIQDFRDKLLFGAKGNYVSNIKNFNSRLDNIINGLVGKNKFVTVYNFNTKKFTFKNRLTGCIGYENEQFTIESLNNASNSVVKITHPEDIKHKIRYDTIAYKLMTSNYNLESLIDYYKLSFRIKDSSNKIVRVDRASYIFELSENKKLISQLDTWEVFDNTSSYVIPSLFTPDYKDMWEQFYNENCVELGIRFTKRQRQIINHKNNHLLNKEIQYLEGITIKTVENHVTNIMNKVREFCKKQQLHKIQINSIHESIELLKKYGLFPFPLKI